MNDEIRRKYKKECYRIWMRKMRIFGSGFNRNNSKKVLYKLSFNSRKMYWKSGNSLDNGMLS
ncbi:MAG: hypothetical protein ACTSRH_03885 [Promethearchaeota archaeon]